MAKYFCISRGLRGCYMPDDVYHVMVKTRRELKEIIISEADMAAGESTIGLSKKAIAAFAARCWYEAQKPKLGLKPSYLPHALPYGERGQISKYPYGIFASVASRADYLEYEKTRDE